MTDEVDMSQLRRLLDAIVTIGGDLDLEVVLRRVVETAVDLVGAKYGALGVLDRERTHLVEFVTVGLDAHERSMIGEPPKGHGILGLLIVDPRPIRLPDLTRHPDSFGFPPGHPPMTSFLGVPILVGGKAFGNLYLTDKLGGGPFDEDDEQMAVGLAAAASVAIDNARLHARVREIDLVEERERIARDLHDTVIQRLFATGLSLQAALRFMTRPEAIERTQRAVDHLDETVREIRTAIFDLHQRAQERSGTDGFRRQVLDLGTELGDALGFVPTFRFDGPLDTVVGPDVAEHAIAVVREGLANVARHAGASRADVTVELDGDVLRVDVVDDGVGPRAGRSTGHGVANVVERAHALGGSAALVAGVEGGSRLSWTVPLDGARAGS